MVLEIQNQGFLNQVPTLGRPLPRLAKDLCLQPEPVAPQRGNSFRGTPGVLLLQGQS